MITKNRMNKHLQKIKKFYYTHRHSRRAGGRRGVGVGVEMNRGDDILKRCDSPVALGSGEGSA
ncbi:MAG: hypothetical protein D6816_14220 [Bacteroidetes bacterium]|nr:MAG: hypothetical protein D6816_14220 [Bacteroidota bacterium]